jgi:hypothetical protein
MMSARYTVKPCLSIIERSNPWGSGWTSLSPCPVGVQSVEFHPASFFENENKTTTYPGLEQTSALRTLAVSYPVLDAFMAFHSISNNVRVHISLALLADSVEPHTNVQRPEEKWPVDTTDKNMAHKRACRIATILANLKHSPEQMYTLTADLNQNFQDTSIKTLCESHPQIKIDNIKHSPPPLHAKLGPLRLESAVEPLNRCYVLLKYVCRLGYRSDDSR